MTTRTCMYCGQPIVRVRKGEHILPEAIGGVRSIKDVCPQCNNGVLSVLDNELCQASPIAIIARTILGNGIGQTWDVDHQDGNLLLEAQPSWSEQSMTVWPQIILDRAGPELHGDCQEMREVGPRNFYFIFWRHLRKAYYRWQATGRGLFFRQLRSPAEILKDYRYPPRVFAERRIHDFSDNMTFVIGYVDENGKLAALNAVDQWDFDRSFKEFGIRSGSALPVVRRSWDLVKVLRALTKLGLNLLHDTCERTIVDRNSFSDAVEFVMGKALPLPHLFRQCGFVWPSDLATLHREDDGHGLRLLYDRARWRLYCSFFGGKVCATIRFPGPSEEHWRTADISTPLANRDRDISGDWRVDRHTVLLPLRCHIEWADPARVIPSVEMLNTKCQLDVKAVPKTE